MTEKDVELIYNTLKENTIFCQYHQGMSCSDIAELTHLPIIIILQCVTKLVQENKLICIKSKVTGRYIKRYIINESEG